MHEGFFFFFVSVENYTVKISQLWDSWEFLLLAINSDFSLFALISLLPIILIFSFYWLWCWSAIGKNCTQTPATAVRGRRGAGGVLDESQITNYLQSEGCPIEYWYIAYQPKNEYRMMWYKRTVVHTPAQKVVLLTIIFCLSNIT